MSLPAPKLDDRTFQDIVNETKRLIPRYCPEWTDHNVSDPGVTFIELFAYMTDVLLYRLNRVPARNYVKWLDMLGIRLEPPKPAHSDITFYLNGPQPAPVTLPAGTQIATVRTESQEAIPYITDVDLTIYVPTLFQLLVSRDGSTYHDYMPALSNPALNVGIFQDPPQPNDAMYFGFHEDLKGHILRLELDSMIEGIGVNPKDPPLTWEYWDAAAQEWLPLTLESDSTGGLNRPGQVVLHVPFSAQARDLDGKVAFWLRVRATAPRPNQPAYSAAPRVRSVQAVSLGGIVPASQVQRIDGEVLGRSNGKANQEWTLSHYPVLARRPGETLEVEDDDGSFVTWTEVSDFGSSKPEDRHFTLDSQSGVIRFGPTIRDAAGRLRQYGAYPPEGRMLRFTGYRIGGGTKGNVGKNSINVLKSSIPYVAEVTNAASAAGGEDAESLEQAMLRGPQLLRARSRAVTAEDFEYLAREATSEVVRARCVPPSAEDIAACKPVIRLLLVPDNPHVDTPIPWQELYLSDRSRAEIMTYLNARRLVTTQVQLDPPAYRFVAVEVTVVARRRAVKEELQGAIERALYRFVNPVHGGPDGQGWPWGRNLFNSEITAMVHLVDGVEYVESMRLFEVDVLNNMRTPIESALVCPPNGLLASATHRVTVQ